MQHKFQRELLAKQEVAEESRAEVRGAVREAIILKAKLQAIEGWRNHEILALRAAGRDAADNLKVYGNSGREDSLMLLVDAHRTSNPSVSIVTTLITLISVDLSHVMARLGRKSTNDHH